MEEADSLLGLLMPKEPEVELSTSPGHKRPKDDRTVIEELHTLNTQLRAFISQLLGQLETSEKQVGVNFPQIPFYSPSNTVYRRKYVYSD